MSAIIDFYRDEKGVANPSGYSHFDIVHNWSDHDWEAIHDFIQWVFPLKEPSNFNPDAPLLTDEDIAIFQADETIRTAVVSSIHRFFRFLGLRLRPENDMIRAAIHGDKTFSQWWVTEIIPANDNTPGAEFFTKAQVEEKAKVWQYPNHNWLRITRCIHSCKLMGFEHVAQSLFDCLCKIYDSNQGVTPDTFKYWQEAAQGGLE